MNEETTINYISDFHGLNNEEVISSRKLYGKNIFIKNEHPYFIQLTKEVVTEPMFILLLITCAIYFILGEQTEGMMMVVALILVSGISVYQTIRSNNATKALYKLSQTKAKVIREGSRIELNQDELVVGDFIIVEEGDIIPADGELLKSYDFSVNESILTGESYSVAKNPTNEKGIFLGTQVVSGYAVAKITAIGDLTKIGELGIAIQEISKSKTQLQIQIDHFVKNMALFGLVAFIAVWLINYTSSKDIYESLLQGLTLAMSALPEEIPVAFSTFMALGAWRLIRKKVLTKQPQTVESLGAASVICLDKTGTITENKMVVEKVYLHDSTSVLTLNACKTGDCIQVLQDAMLASEVQPFDPMEIAIHQAYSQVALNDIRPVVTMYHEYPLTGHPPMMTHVYNQDHKTLIACKGGWEKIIEISKLSKKESDQIKIIAQEMAREGLRVLGTAHVLQTQIDHFPEKQEDFTWNFSGLIALSDPPKKNINLVFDKFYQAGIQIKMITGDFPETALSIAEKSGLKNQGKIYSGREIMQMSDDEVEKAVKSSNVFARMFPEAKLKVINTLKRNGEVVAMTGDGVNDGPALKAAEIGVAMGTRGTEIARKAADIILIDDDLEHMVDAVEAGRKIYYNLKKAFRYIISIHIPIIMVVTLPLALGWKFPNIFSPVHVIFLELIMGPTCSIIYENEPTERHIMKTPPRIGKETLFSWRELSISIFQGLIITFFILAFYQWATLRGHSEAEVRTITFTTLIFSNMFLTLSNRSFEKSILQTIKYKNPLIPAIFAITLIIWFAALHISPLKNLFQFEHISQNLILLCISIGAIAVLWIELVKCRRVRSKHRLAVSN